MTHRYSGFALQVVCGLISWFPRVRFAACDRALVVGMGLILGLGMGLPAHADVPAALASGITAPAYVTSLQSGYTASVINRVGYTFKWTITGGTFANGFAHATGDRVLFTAGPVGNLTLYCTTRYCNRVVSTATKSVKVVPAPSITSFMPARNPIPMGMATTLMAVFSHGMGQVDQGIGTILSGTPLSTGNLEATRTFVLSVTNRAGTTVTAQTLVNVVPNPVISSFQADPTTIPIGQSSRLTAVFSGGAGQIVGVGFIASGGAIDVRPTETTTYTLLVTNELGIQQTATVEVTVTPASPLQSRATGSMMTPRNQAAGSLLRSGKALITGGYGFSGKYDFQASAEIYDPVSETFSATGSMAFNRYEHTQTTLSDGRVLIAGGLTVLPTGGSALVSELEIYDPSTGMFSTVGTMVEARQRATATLLKDGRVLIAGGYGSPILATAEIFDPVTNTCTPTGSLSRPRDYHRSILLQDGRVLIVGGNDFYSDIPDAEIYDPTTGQFSPAGTLGKARWWHDVTLLDNGEVLIVGGGNSVDGYLLDSELFDPKTLTFRSTGAMIHSRGFSTATLLKTGQVLVAGGVNDALGTCEVYDPLAGTFSVGPALVQGRYQHLAIRLDNGAVLICGGSMGNTDFLASAELIQ